MRTIAPLAGLLFIAGSLAGPGAMAGTPEVPDERLLRSWQELDVVDERAIVREVQLVMDYRQGHAILRILDDAGEIVETRPARRNPQPSQEEIDVAYGIVREDPSSAAILEAHNAILDGGFILFEEAGKPCSPGTRCMQIFAFRRGAAEVPLFRVVVDMTKNEIVYRDNWDMGGAQ
jgi:hypothetical protein